MNFKRFIYEDENEKKEEKPFNVKSAVHQIKLSIVDKHWIDNHLEEIVKEIVETKNAQAAFWLLKNLPKDKQIPALISTIETSTNIAYQYLRDLIIYKNIPFETIEEKIPSLIDAAITENTAIRAVQDLFPESTPPLKVLKFVLANDNNCIDYMHKKYNAKNIPDAIKHKAFDTSLQSLYSYLQHHPEYLRDDSYYKYFFRHADNPNVASYMFTIARMLEFKDIPQPIMNAILADNKTATQYYDVVGYDNFDPKDYKKLLGSAKACFDYAKRVLKFQNVPQEILDKIATDPKYAVNYVLWNFIEAAKTEPVDYDAIVSSIPPVIYDALPRIRSPDSANTLINLGLNLFNHAKNVPKQVITAMALNSGYMTHQLTQYFDQPNNPKILPKIVTDMIIDNENRMDSTALRSIISTCFVLNIPLDKRIVANISPERAFYMIDQWHDQETIKNIPEEILFKALSYLEEHREEHRYSAYNILRALDFRSGLPQFIYDDAMERMVNGREETSNFNFVETTNSKEMMEAFNRSLEKSEKLRESYEKWYKHPKKAAQKYNELFHGYFYHTCPARSVFFNLENSKKNTDSNELCVCSFDSVRLFDRNNYIMIGTGNLRLLFDFDCYSEVENNGSHLRYATPTGSHSGAIADINKPKYQRVKEYLKNQGYDQSKKDADPTFINSEYHDEGFIKPKDADFFLITKKFKDKTNRYDDYYQDDMYAHREFMKQLKNYPEVKFIDYAVFDRMIMGGWAKAVEILDKEYFAKVPDDTHDDEELYGKIAEDTYLANNDHEGFDLDKAFDIITSSYTKSIGGSWGKEKFLSRARNWDFYGDDKGFVAVREQKSGLLKLVAVAGEVPSIMKGMNDVVKQNKPLWGAALPKIVSVISKKYGFIVPPKMVTEFILNRMKDNGVMSDATLNADGSITINDPEVGQVTKQFFCNPQYVEWALKNMNVPEPIAKLMTGMLHIKKAVGAIGSLFKESAKHDFKTFYEETNFNFIDSED